MSSSLNLKLVLPRLATKTSMICLERAGARRCAESGQEIAVGTGDHVRSDQLADFSGGFSAGINGGTDAADIAFDDRGDECAADLDRFDDLDVGGLAHRVGG